MRSKIRNVLLIRPAITQPRDMGYQGIGEPLGVLYIAAFLRGHGYKVHVFDAASAGMVRERRGGYLTYGSDYSGLADVVA